MKRFILRYRPLLLLLTLLSASCAPVVYIPLKPEYASKIGGTRVYAAIPQEEITAVVEKSNVAAAGGGGLLLALIDAAVESSRTSTANKLIEPVRKEVTDFDFRAQFFDSLQKTLPGVTTLRLAKIDSTAKPLSDKERAALRKQIAEDGLLSVSTAYELSSDFQSLSVVTIASLWLRDQEEAVYLAKYQYYTPSIAASKNREEAAKAWADGRGAALRAALTEGIAETMKMFQLDLRAPTAPLNVPAEGPDFSAGPIPARASQSSLTYLAKDNHRYIIRYKDVLYSASDEKSFVPASASRP